MSHFTVAVFTRNGVDEVDDLLAPYDENISVAPYVANTKEQLIQRERDQLQVLLEGPYAQWQKDPQKYEADHKNPEHIAYLKSIPELLARSDEQIYTAVIERYDKEEITPDGGVLSTYNPSSKWDWYQIGGRWTGMLILKEGCDGYRGSPGLMTEPSEDYDSALVSDIDFEAMWERYSKHLAPYEEAMKNGFYKEEFMREQYPSEEEYIRRQTTFSTYAVITPDGAWHAPGDMSWWGMSSDTSAESRDWDLNYYDRFIQPAIENGWHMTIVDCHI